MTKFFIGITLAIFASSQAFAVEAVKPAPKPTIESVQKDLDAAKMQVAVDAKIVATYKFLLAEANDRLAAATAK